MYIKYFHIKGNFSSEDTNINESNICNHAY